MIAEPIRSGSAKTDSVSIVLTRKQNRKDNDVGDFRDFTLVFREHGALPSVVLA